MASDPLSNGLRWLEQAEDELDAAYVLRDAGKHYLVCFLCQQVAEKAIKAVFFARGALSVYGHSVGSLCRKAAKFDAELAALEDRLASLDAYYIPTRYPNALPDSIPARVYKAEQSSDALARAKEAVAAARARLKKEPKDQILKDPVTARS